MFSYKSSLMLKRAHRNYELGKQRHQLYLEACDHRINIDTLNITDKIIELTKNKFEVNPQTYFTSLLSFICMHFALCAFECIADMINFRIIKMTKPIEIDNFHQFCFESSV